MEDSPIRIIQVSDTHIYADKERALLGVKTYKSFQVVLDLMQQEVGKMDMIIHSGDLSQDYSERSYIYVADMLNPFNVPVYCIPGNHDDPKMMAQVLPRDMISYQRHVVLKNWQFILLDTHKSQAVEGYLSHAQLNHLRHCLQSYPEHHAVVVLHHQPFPVGSRWLDNIGLTNAQNFWDVILQFSNVTAILFGHVHQVCEQEIHGIPCYSTPSTCIQFKPNQDKFGLDKIPPGYRWIHLYKDGSLKTGVVRAEKYVGYFDEKAKGY